MTLSPAERRARPWLMVIISAVLLWMIFASMRPAPMPDGRMPAEEWQKLFEQANDERWMLQLKLKSYENWTHSLGLTLEDQGHD